MKIRKRKLSRARREGKFSAVFEKRGKIWIAWMEELPGANTQGKTLNGARENLKEAIKLVISANRELACPDAFL